MNHSAVRYIPTGALMDPLLGLNFYADSLLGVSGIDGAIERRALRDYVAWAGSSGPVTEQQVVAKVEELLGVIIVEHGLRDLDDIDTAPVLEGVWAPRYHRAQELASVPLPTIGWAAAPAPAIAA